MATKLFAEYSTTVNYYAVNNSSYSLTINANRNSNKNCIVFLADFQGEN